MRVFDPQGRAHVQLEWWEMWRESAVSLVAKSRQVPQGKLDGERHLPSQKDGKPQAALIDVDTQSLCKGE